MEKGRKILKQFVTLIIYLMGAFHLYTGFFGAYESFYQRTVHFSFAILLIFLLHPYKTRFQALNIALTAVTVGLSVVSMGYLYVNYDYVITQRYPFVTPLTGTEFLLGLCFLVLLLEATRKVAGIALPIVALVFLLYGLVGPYLPGILSHAGYSVENIIDLNYLGTEGAFGIPIGASATYIALFIMFGAFLARSGVGSMMMDLAMGLAGHTKGGPAKVSVIGSALHGMLSGSAVANVLTVGTSTIPLMKY